MDEWEYNIKKLGKINTGSQPKFILFLRGKIIDIIHSASTPKL